MFETKFKNKYRISSNAVILHLDGDRKYSRRASIIIK